ncbi:RlmI/RlmK family 23S rRNA methyltransferase [Stutzerimonas nosocomialis]|uniref:RlmI/RlmK family 23S rRNA methyltransferase n=1 Tax=Stutzerimonas nosocomialis TaxID=1056496 RepID=A0A5R9QDG6_9GAMM|nr:class I SAM-dependent rRNA methyltransferase [Stutzerimonas nosocomialis]TLX57942.1 RlmI/RlmK family 23S rRNA methyltransferase [Stutzerimonas nosocomialis]TLX59798.1 RlmI/RlmK family 23S rRNA methyltransferase [Stutzerimonas nosocomialis]TLX63177.1 RlmI/RlmK family 23S rRNA methyltransferase [Stutzerimonas nosocomialis]
MTLPSLRLKANADRRLRAGHLWVYSNEIDTAVTPLNAFPAGAQAVLEAAGGRPLGIVGVSPNNLICARLLSRDLKHSLDKSLLVHRIKVALSLRERLFDQPCYRLVYGDSDLLPGLVVDRFHDILVVQLASATMEQHREAVLEALVQVLKPRGVLWKNDSSARDAEGLERYVDTAFGVVPEWVALEENGVKFEAPVMQGQKTGWFYDHRMNRARLAPYVKGKRVLDLFSYIGGWGVQAAAFGATEVMCVDASAFALDGVERNATLNGVAERLVSVEGDVFEAIKELKAAEERFDVVIADPPAFIKRKKDLKNGEAAYRRLNEQAMRLLSKDGVLVSASCSMHLPEDDLQNILLSSARHLDRNIQLLERGAQGPDHPVHPAIPETRYIKSLTCRLLPNS